MLTLLRDLDLIDATALRVAGVDLSLRSTGVAVAAFDGDGAVQVETLALQPRAEGHDRLEEICASIVALGRAVDLLVLEGLAPNARFHSGELQATAGNWWLVRHELWREQVEVAVVPPNVRAKYATGSGSAGKAFVVEAVASTYRHLLTLPTAKARGREDIADAVALMAMGCRHLGPSIEPIELPTANLAAMPAAAWPAREVAPA